MQKTAAKRCPGDKGNKNKKKKSTPPARQSTVKSTGKKKQAKNTVKPKVLSFAEKMRAKVQKVTTKAPQKAKQKVTQKKANNYNSGASTMSSGKKGTTSNLDSHNKKKKEL